MLDPRVQQKGGFGAFAAREQARRDERTGAEAQAAPVATDDAAGADALTAGQSDARPAEKIRPRARDGT
jgi:hypothetical protein